MKYFLFSNQVYTIEVQFHYIKDLFGIIKKEEKKINLKQRGQRHIYVIVIESISTILVI